MAGLHWDATMNGENLFRTLKEIMTGVNSVDESVKGMGKSFDDAANEATKSTNVIKDAIGGVNDVAGKLGNIISLAFVGNEIKQFVGKLEQVRGSFQDIESSMTVFLGSEEKAKKFVEDLNDYAWYNMFEFSDLAEQASLLLAYGNDVNEILGPDRGMGGILDKLSNIASGTHAQLGELVSLFNRAKSRGFVDSEAMMSWASRGLVIKEVMKEMGYEGNITRITFEQLNEVLDYVTSNGGMFAGLMEEQLDNISASRGQLEDDITNMYNEIGTAMEDNIKRFIDAEDWVVANYKQIGKTILELVGVYGVYRAALITFTAIHKLQVQWTQAEATAKLLAAAAGKTLTAQEAREAVVSSMLATVKERLTLAQEALNKAILKNPYVLAAAGVAALALALYKYATRATAAEKAQEDFNKSVEDFNELEDQRRSKVSEDISTIQDETKTKAQKILAYEELKKYSSALTDQYSLEELEVAKLHDIEKTRNKENDEIRYQHLNDEVEKYTSSIQELRNQYVSYQNALQYSGQSSTGVLKMMSEITRQIEINEEKLKLAEDALKEYEDAIEQAKFDSLPIEQRIEIMQKKKEEAQEEIDRAKKVYDDYVSNNPIKFGVEVLPPSTEDLPTFEIATSENGNNATANQYEQRWGSPWGGVDAQKLVLDQQVAAAVQAQKQIDDDLAALQRENDENNKKHNKEYWSNIKKNAQDALDGLDESKIGTQEWNDLVKEINDADNHLKKFSVTVKNSKKADTSVADYAREVSQRTISMERAIRDREFALRQAEIDSKEESGEIAVEQLKLNHEKEIEEIRREQEDYLRKKIDTERALFMKNPANKGKENLFDESSVTLTTEEVAYFDTMIELLKKRQEKESAELDKKSVESMNQYLKEYGNYEQKKAAITKLYEGRIKSATTEGEVMSLNEQRDRELYDLEVAYKKTTSAIVVMFQDLSGKSVKELRSLYEEGKKTLDFLTSGEWNEEEGIQFGITEETFNRIINSPDELEKIRKGLQDIKDEADDCDTAFNRIGIGMKKMFSSEGDLNEFSEGMEELSDAIGDVVSALNFVSSSMSKVSDSFGEDSSIAQGIETTTSAINDALSGAAAGFAVGGPWGAAIGAAIGVVTSLVSSLSKIHDDGWQNVIDDAQDKIDDLDKSYEKLDESVGKAFSSDKAKLIAEQNELLERQIALINEQEAAEREKKNTDEDAINSYDDKRRELLERIEDNKRAAEDAIFGSDVQSAIENFSSAYADAWANGENRTKYARDVVRSMMKQMVRESISAAVQSSKKMEEIRNKLRDFYKDGIFENWEQNVINDMVDGFQKELDSQFAWSEGLLSDKSDESKAGSTRSLSTMTSEQADSLEGRFTALQISNEQIAQSMIQTVSSLINIHSTLQGTNSIISDILVQNALQTQYLEMIAKFNKTFVEHIEKIDDIVKNTENI